MTDTDTECGRIGRARTCLDDDLCVCVWMNKPLAWNRVIETRNIFVVSNLVNTNGLRIKWKVFPHDSKTVSHKRGIESHGAHTRIQKKGVLPHRDSNPGLVGENHQS